MFFCALRKDKPGTFGIEFRGELWLTKRKQQNTRRRASGRDRAGIVLVEIVRDLAAAVVAGVDRVVLRAKADANFSGARKSASSASRKSKTSTTKTTGCSASSSLRVARSCRVA